MAPEASNGSEQTTLNLADATIQAKLASFVARSSRQWRERSQHPQPHPVTSSNPTGVLPRSMSAYIEPPSSVATFGADPKNDRPSMQRARSTSSSSAYASVGPPMSQEAAPPQITDEPPARKAREAVAPPLPPPPS